MAHGPRPSAGLKLTRALAGPEVGGPHGPYRQSERSALHREHARKLVASGHAYRCFCTPERLQALAAERRRAGLPTDYDRTCCPLPREQAASRAAAGEPHVVRLKAPDRYPGFRDAVYGRITFAENARAHALGSFEDPILLKSDGLPTYHLASVVDDHHMRITHVCRATEWLPSTPKHVHLYACFGWTPPEFVHVGLLQNAQRGKLSKRSGDVFVSEYRRRGYLPAALDNFVALLGWSHGQTSDVMGLRDMAARFDTARLTPGNTVVNFEKLDFLQKRHVRATVEAGGAPADAIFEAVVEHVSEAYGDRLETGAPITRDYIALVFHANLQNYLLPAPFVASSSCFFRAPASPDAKLLRQVSKYLSDHGLTYAALVSDLVARLSAVESGRWTAERLHDVVEAKPDDDRARWAAAMRAVRLALTGGEPGPSVAATMAVLGRDRVLCRLQRAEDQLAA